MKKKCLNYASKRTYLFLCLILTFLCLYNDKYFSSPEKITRKRKQSRSRSPQQSSLQKPSQITYKSTNPATCVTDLQINKLTRAEVNVSTPTNNRKSEVGRLKVSKGGRCLTSNDAIQELKDKNDEKVTTIILVELIKLFTLILG